ncbi:MAG: SDR family oxidoreductase [Acidimicrobiales bacterium]
MASVTVLITGGAGYLGSGLARRYVESTDVDVVVTVRPASPSPPPLPGGIRVVPADLAGPDPLAALDPGPITRIVHAAAATRFDIDDDTARASVRATEAVVAFARRCPRLESLVLLSTVYASGLANGPIAEAPLRDEPVEGFANNYEQSKWASERALLKHGAALPWQILRLATVIAVDASGTVTQHNAFHRTLDLWFHGLLSVLPGRPGTPLPVISGRFAIEAVTTASGDGVFHATPDAASVPTLAEVIELVTHVFDADPAYRRRRVERPLLTDQEAFELLAGAVGSFRASLAGQAVKALRPFARQLYSVKQFETGRLAVRPDDPRLLIAATACELVRTRWGRHAVA